MRNDLTDITLVVDRSGSMESCRTDAEGGINAFIKEQQSQPGYANFTLVQFDTEYEFVWNGVDIQKVLRYKLVPRGSTALLDAVGRAINSAGLRLSNMPEAERPACVIFVIVTDGQENASREFTKSQIKEMIEIQQTKYNWKFTFLGADANTFADAHSYGFKGQCVANYLIQNSAVAYDAVSSNVSAARCCTMQGKTDVSLEYTEEQRNAMTNPVSKKGVSNAAS